jgi:hypothetical protein
VLLASRPSHPLGSVDELLDFEDEEFQHCAYLGVLRREPDPEGFAYYAGQLREGRLSKLAILAQLRGSAEGRGVVAPIAGLDAALRWERWGRLPLIGVMFRAMALVRELPMLGRRVRRLRRVRSDVYRVSKVMESTLHVFHRAVDRLNLLQVSDVERRENVRGLSQLMLTLGQALAAVEASAAAGRDELRAVAQTAAELQRVLDDATRRMQAMADESVAHRALSDETRARADAMAIDLRNAGAQIADLTTGIHAFAAETRGHLGVHDTAIREHDSTIREHDEKTRRMLQELASSSSPGAEAANRANEVFLLGEVYASFEDRFRGRARRSRSACRSTCGSPLGRGHEEDPASRRGLRSRRVARIPSRPGHSRARRRSESLPRHVLPRPRARCRRRRCDSLPARIEGRLPRRRHRDARGRAHGAARPRGIPRRGRARAAPRRVRRLRDAGPENLIVGAYAFWLDPSHLRPIPSQTLAFLVESRGFASTEIRRLHPFPEDERTAPGEVPDRVAELLFGPRDYAVIARKVAQ